jgi:hypothetical protein
MARKRHAKAIPQRKLDYVRIKKEVLSARQG